jgi:DNA-binding transcriptional MerR regulator
LILCKKVRYTTHMYTVSQFAKRVGVVVKTLQRWDRQGILKARRTITNRRYYTDEELAKALQLSREDRDDQSAQDQAPSND